LSQEACFGAFATILEAATVKRKVICALLQSRFNAARVHPQVKVTTFITKTEFNVLYLVPAIKLRDWAHCEGDITITLNRSGTVKIKLNTLHAVHLINCAGKLGELSDFSGFASLLAPTVRVFKDSDPDGEAAVPLFYDGHAEDLNCFVPARAGGGKEQTFKAVRAARKPATGRSFTYDNVEPVTIYYRPINNTVTITAHKIFMGDNPKFKAALEVVWKLPLSKQY
jgi:hypothetical protein